MTMQKAFQQFKQLLEERLNLGIFTTEDTIRYTFYAALTSAACRLRRKEVVGKRGPIPFMAELELENLSTSDVEIKYQMAVLQYLNLIVSDTNGSVVSEGHFGDRFSPFEHAKQLRLAPGEKFHANVHLLATMPRGPIAPATYFVQAIYEYNGFRAVSGLVEVTV